MSSDRTIVGIGEILLHRTPGHESVGGLAAVIARHAARLGYVGVPISRVGQDEAGDRIIQSMREEGISADHIQTDPDLATGRLTERILAGKTTITLEARSAFDNLQWDYDLEDVAQRAEAVVFGTLARRNSQTRNSIDRFLDLCPHALTVLNLMNSQPDCSDRTAMSRALDLADAAVIDHPGLHLMSPGGGGEPDDVLVSALRRRHKLAFMVLCGSDGRLRACADDVHAASEGVITANTVQPAIMGVLHGLLCGWDWPKSLAAGVRYAQFVEVHEDDSPPTNLFDAH